MSSKWTEPILSARSCLMFLAQALHSTLMMMPPRRAKAIRRLREGKSRGQLTNWAFKVNRDERTQVSLGVLVGIVEAGESAAWIILDWSDVLQVSGVLALARHPDCVQLKVHFMRFRQASERQSQLTACGSFSATPPMNSFKSLGMLLGKRVLSL
jgi:hypothetical protein